MPYSSQIRVLVVDSLAASRKHIVQLLLPLPDIEVAAVARSGAEGLRVAEVLKPNVILLDPNQPDVDSLETIEALVAGAPDAPIIVLSAMSDPAFLQSAYRAGVRALLPQPPPAAKLAELIRKVSRAT